MNHFVNGHRHRNRLRLVRHHHHHHNFPEGVLVEWQDCSNQIVFDYIVEAKK